MPSNIEIQSKYKTVLRNFWQNNHAIKYWDTIQTAVLLNFLQSNHAIKYWYTIQIWSSASELFANEPCHQILRYNPNMEQCFGNLCKVTMPANIEIQSKYGAVLRNILQNDNAIKYWDTIQIWNSASKLFARQPCHQLLRYYQGGIRAIILQ